MLVVCVVVHVLCSSSACVSSVISWFFDVFPPDICLVFVYEGGYFFV